MDIHAALEKVVQWCAEQTAAGDPDTIEIDCHAAICITIGESAPPWAVRMKRRSSAGASAPVAQLHYDFETREWLLHHGTHAGWCEEHEAVSDSELGPLLAEIGSDREGRYRGLGRGFGLSRRCHET
jgi:hypothetical protein